MHLSIEQLKHAIFWSSEDSLAYVDGSTRYFLSPEETRLVIERLQNRIVQLEKRAHEQLDKSPDRS